MSSYVVTIDGPSASGKTSVSRDLANSLGWKWVSTGTFYRGLAVVALKENIELENHQKMADLANSNIWSVEMTSQETSLVYRGQKLTAETFREEVGMLASKISQYTEVREALLPLQRACASPGHVLVAEGRDCGTVVFPDALLKVYLTASSESRALRRSLEDVENVERLKELQAQRDQSDKKRAVAPLQIPVGAEIIDSSSMPREAVVAKVQEAVQLVLSERGLSHLLKKV